MISQNELKAGDTPSTIVAAGLIQRVNLIKFISKQQKIYLSLNQILRICALLIIIFSFYSIHDHWKKAAVNKRIANLKSQYAVLVKSMSSGRMKKIQELESASSVYSVLQTLLLKNGTGFTNYLETFAANCPNGLWLTSINIKKRSDTAILSGKAYQPGSIVQFMDNLNRALLFQKAPFFLAKIEKVVEPITDNKKATEPATDITTYNNIKPTVVYSFTLQTQITAELKT